MREADGQNQSARIALSRAGQAGMTLNMLGVREHFSERSRLTSSRLSLPAEGALGDARSANPQSQRGKVLDASVVHERLPGSRGSGSHHTLRTGFMTPVQLVP